MLHVAQASPALLSSVLEEGELFGLLDQVCVSARECRSCVGLRCTHTTEALDAAIVRRHAELQALLTLPTEPLSEPCYFRLFIYNYAYNQPGQQVPWRSRAFASFRAAMWS